MFENTFKNKKVIITGHTGFKGSWLTIWLQKLGAEVIGISDKRLNGLSNFEISSLSSIVRSEWIDIRDYQLLSKKIKDIKPDFIFHLAAQSLVKESIAKPLETYQTNMIGTVNLLETLRHIENKVTVVMITSDKVYRNQEWIWGYRENDIIGGKDPYSASKGSCDIAINSYYDMYFAEDTSNVSIASARAGNVIGGGDWAQDRIVPDAVRAWSCKQVLQLRAPYSTRPWQHVLEPLYGYLKLASILSSKKTVVNGQSYNFGPNAQNNFTVYDLVKMMSQLWEGSRWEDISNKTISSNEAGLLKLNCDKALTQIDWSPVLNIHETIKMTIDWYLNYYEGIHKTMYKICEEQIDTYENKISTYL